MAALLALVVGSLANNISLRAKKHTECFNAGLNDGKDHPFDASRFDRCGKNYQDGFLKDCQSVKADSHEECESAAPLQVIGPRVCNTLFTSSNIKVNPSHDLHGISVRGVFGSAFFGLPAG